MIADKRRYERTQLDTPAELIIENYHIVCKTNDISKNGISFLLPSEVSIELNCPIVFTIEFMGEKMVKEGKVVRISRDRKQTFIGCEFIE